MTIDNLSSEALALLRAKNVSVTSGFDGPIVGHVTNVRVHDGKCIGDVHLTDEQWQAIFDKAGVSTKGVPIGV